MNQISKAKEPIEPTDMIVMEAINLPVPSEVAKKIKEGFNAVYAKIEAEIKEHVPDVTTKAGRAKIASLAYKISRTKTGLDDTAAKLTEDQKQMINAVNVERREMRESLDKLRDQARAPLDQWEKDEEERIQTVIGIFESFTSLISDATGGSSDHISEIFKIVQNTAIEEELFKKRFEEGLAAKNTTLDNLEREFTKQLQYERDQAELEALRKERDEVRLAQLEAERIEEERLAKIASIEAERAAEAKRAEGARIEEIRIREAEEQAAKNAAKAAELKAAEKIAAAKREAEAAKVAAKKAGEDAERQAAEAKAQAERDKEQALQQERQKVAQERLAKEKEEAEFQAALEKRASDLTHRKRINRVVMEALIKSSECSEDVANLIILAIKEGMIPHVQINY